MIGSKQVANPRPLMTMQKNIERFPSGATKPMTPSAPWNIPPAPTPAMALPSIKAGELGAEAEVIDPASADMNISIESFDRLCLVYNLKFQDREQIYSLDLEQSVENAKDRLKPRHSEQIGRAIVANLSENLEHRCDLRDHYPNYGLVDGHRKSSEEKSHKNNVQSQTG
jgi:hypothetical protein